MLDLKFDAPADRPPRLLYIGAHSDDIEIGCGGTVIELAHRYPDAQVKWVVLSSEGSRHQEAESAAEALLSGLPEPVISIEDFRGAYFPSEAAAIKDYFEALKSFAPDAIFTHCREELHQDHRIVEIPKYDGGLGSPCVFVPLSRDSVDRKIDLLMRVFESQHDKKWFTPETFLGLMRLRGIECNATSGYAEAFYSRKLVLGSA